MSTGANIQPGRGLVVTDATPSVDFRNGEAEMWGAAERLTRQVTEAVKPALERKAAEIGQREGADAQKAGTDIARPRFAFGDLAEARRHAADTAYMAGTQNDIDAAESQARTDNSHSVDAYRARMTALRSDFIAKAPHEFGVQVEDYVTRRMNAGVGDVAQNVLGVQLREQNQELAGRMGVLQRQMADELTAHGMTPAYEALKSDWDGVRDARLHNPALPYSDAEAAEDLVELQVTLKAATYTGHYRQILHTEGAQAAVAGLSEILTDPDLGETERQVVFQKVRATLGAEIDNATDAANIAHSARTRAEEEMKKRIEDDAAAVEVGLPGTGLTEAEVLARMGPSGVADWFRKRAEATERNHITGDIAGLPLDEATRRAAAALPGSTATTVVDLSKPLKTPTDFDALAAAVAQVETRGNPAQVSPAGARGAMQLMPDTAREMAALEGIPYDENRLLHDPAYNTRLGKRYLQGMLDQYGGDPQLAVTAYHAGPGLVDAWLKPEGTVTPVRLGNRTVQARGHGDPRAGEFSFDDWLEKIGPRDWPESVDYPRAVARALGSGRNAAEWQATQTQALVTAATQGLASDPINFATTHRLHAPIPLTIDAPFAGGQPAAAWGEAMRARAALGTSLATERNAPQRFFTNGEVQAYRDRFTRNPADAVAFGRQAYTALGPQARDALIELGQGSSASPALLIADLAAAGGDTHFSDQAARGLTMQATGQTLEKEASDSVNEALTRFRRIYADSPVTWQAITSAARAAALADQADGRVNTDATRYVQAAMGQNQFQGRTYGGTAAVNGATTLLPRWMAPDYADDALEALANEWTTRNRGPVYRNDAPIPAREIARMRLTPRQDGSYMLVDRDNRVAYARNGRPFAIDFEAGRTFLASRLGPNAVRPQ